MVNLRPVNGNIILKPILQSEVMKQHVAANSGLLMVTPKEGVPRRGIVKFVPEGEPFFKPGDDVQFFDESPQGLHWEDEGYLIIPRDKIAGKWVQ